MHNPKYITTESLARVLPWRWFIVPLTALALSGCGGSAPSHPSTGSATFDVAWPSLNSTSTSRTGAPANRSALTSRLVPSQAQSIVITATDESGNVEVAVVERPTGNQSSDSSATLSGLQAGPCVFSAVAYPLPQGQGVADADAHTLTDIPAGGTATVGLTLDTTIAQVYLTQSPPIQGAGGEIVSIGAVGLDGEGRIVLASFTWSMSTPNYGSNPTPQNPPTIDSSGNVTIPADVPVGTYFTVTATVEGTDVSSSPITVTVTN
ncbi:MAG: hypothetical protein ACLQVD_16560 [Capsulimonadaceae bacterium]